MAARKATKKTATKKAASRATKTAVTKPSVDAVMSSINAKMKSEVIKKASDMNTLYLLRRPTGIVTLDIDLGGGFPSAATSVLVGPDGAGKDYILWRTCAEVQKIYGDDFAMVAYLTEFKADKPFMRNMCGLKIAFSDEEIEDYDNARIKAGHPPLTDEDKEELTTQVGKIFLIDGVTAEEGFDALIEVVKSNTCQIAAINSIGFLQTAAKEATDSFTEFPQQRNEAMLLSKFMPKLAMTLNNDDNGRNETSLIIINQVRARDGAARVMRGRTPQEKDKYEPGSKSFALKHGKAIELLLHKGTTYRDAEMDNAIIGRKIPYELTKGKLGTHDGIKGDFDFYYDGGADIIGDLYNACVSYDIFSVSGAWISYEDEDHGFDAVQGKDKVRRRMLEDSELVEHLREKVLQAAGVVCRFR